MQVYKVVPGSQTSPIVSSNMSVNNKIIKVQGFRNIVSIPWFVKLVIF